LQLNTYIDRMRRDVPLQSWEDRTTYDIELQHSSRILDRHRLVWGGGYRLSRDRTQATPVLFFEPERRDLFTWNLFAEDEFALVRSRLFVTLGSKFEHTTFTGWEAQPNARVRFQVSGRQMLWGAVSRAVRTPTRFDQDLRILLGGVTAIRGDRDFKSEKLIAYEAGWRQQVGSQLTFGVSTFINQYDDLRSQEPTPPFGLPIVLRNMLNATSKGFEVVGTIQASRNWLLRSAYTFLDLERSLDAASSDPTGGAAEGNDPTHQFSFRSYLTLGHGIEVDAFLRASDALPGPRVPAYAELDLRVGWRSPRLELSVTGRDLLHDRHAEFGASTNRREFPREIVTRAILFF
jgi:iron complex outermembrane receptor protein